MQEITLEGFVDEDKNKWNFLSEICYKHSTKTEHIIRGNNSYRHKNDSDNDDEDICFAQFAQFYSKVILRLYI